MPNAMQVQPSVMLTCITERAICGAGLAGCIACNASFSIIKDKNTKYCIYVQYYINNIYISLHRENMRYKHYALHVKLCGFARCPG